VISLLALLIAWLGQEDISIEQQISLALPEKEQSLFAQANQPVTLPKSTETKPVTPAAPSVATIPVATSHSTAPVHAVPSMAPSSVNASPPLVVNLPAKEIQRINEQAISLVGEGNPRQAIGLLEKTLLEHKDAGPLFENLRRLYAGLATQSYQLALEPGKPKPVTVDLLNPSGDVVTVQIASLDMKARSAAKTLPTETTELPTLPVKPVLATEVAALPLVAEASGDNSSKSHESQVVAVSESIESPVSKEPSTTEKVEANRAVMVAVKRWADAWSKQDPDGYIAMYSPTFKPKDMTRSQWEAYRRDRLTKPKSIRVELSDQKAVMLTKNKMRVTFNQMYASDALKANDKKTLELELIDNQWLIISESGR
jgi:hypothetical protein